ncbi:hypothetical protein COCCADRAFT_10347 [Bipolaris zeicola 26-R-13]|uniref:Uncharacterized protein n=1 Tax=Cochliobolus carbonum (strain 26-R-13) TaxID=930089 RepID=W6Y6G7_COCC2|nr:uncharacterized protein COCCADRAFT_10347 [Bipolaris zeicola 26-R-13]EUC26886.1 hypothetical protein COCCADRAFT_10347 [Bipolaris zeicola 26-R-13]
MVWTFLIVREAAPEHRLRVPLPPLTDAAFDYSGLPSSRSCSPHSSNVQSLWSIAHLRRALLMSCVNPGFIIGLVFLYPASLTTLQTVEAEISTPRRLSPPAMSAQVFSCPYLSRRTYGNICPFTSSVCLAGLLGFGAF